MTSDFLPEIEENMREVLKYIQELAPDIDLAKEYLTSEVVGISEAAEIVGVSRDRMKQIASSGELGVKKGGRYLFTRRELAHYERKPLGRPRNR